MTWIDEARAKYPLPAEEEGLLVNVVLASAVLSMLAAIVGSIILAALQGASLWDAVTFGWAAGIADALKVAWPWSLALGFGLGAVLLAVNAVGEAVALRGSRKEWREAIYEMRGGLSGELPRVTAWKIPLMMLAVAAVEEVGFRYALIGVVMAVAEPAVGFAGAAVVAVAASAAVFALAAVIVAHWLYDVAVVFLEARKMTRDPRYFPNGHAPENAVEEELQKAASGE